MKTILLRIALIAACALLVLALKPIDTSAENSVKVTGIVTSVRESGVRDLVFTLKNNNRTYYINRGLEDHFTLQKARAAFVGKKIKVFYAKNWTPLAPFGNSSKHLTHLVMNDSVWYSEWK